MSNNSNLHKAKKARNDEFYTMLSDIENELMHYREHFKDKVVYCNCDAARESNFFRYFSMNFEFLGLKKLIATGYKKNGQGVKLVYDGDRNGNRTVDDEEVQVTELEGDGDFRSEECVKLLDDADSVVTNPPFSIIDEYLDQLVKHGKKFLFIAPITMLMREDAFNLVQQNKMWFGFGTDSWYQVPNDFDDRPGVKIENGKKFFKVKTRWFTNLDHEKRHEELVCVEKYSPEKYPAYANYPNAVEVGKIANIPVDYYGEMGVAITILDKFNPDQFEIVGGSRWLATKMADMGWPKDSYVPGGVAFYLDESTPTKRRYRRLFGRVVIKRRKPVGENGKTPAV